MLVGYESSDDEPVASSSKPVEEDDEAIERMARENAFGLSDAAPRPRAIKTKAEIAAAPDVLREDVNSVGSAIITRPTDKVMNVNITYADMQRAVEGPQDPFNQKKNKGMNTLSGGCVVDSTNDRPRRGARNG